MKMPVGGDQYWVDRNWWEQLAAQSWPHSQQLTEQQIDDLDTLGEPLDMNDVIKEFVWYWDLNLTTITATALKKWTLPLKLNYWIRNALKRQPSADNRRDDYLRRVLAEQRERGNPCD